MTEIFSFAERTSGQPGVFIGVDYDEFKPETFRGYFVYDRGKRSDNYQTMAEAEAKAFSMSDRVMYLSSVDNYEADTKAAKQRQ